MAAFAAAFALADRLTTHYNVCTLTHSMSMAALIALAREWESSNNQQIDQHIKYKERQWEFDRRRPRAARSNLEEQRRCRDRKPWIITSRKIEISEFLDLKNCLKIHYCSSLVVRPRSMVVCSSYEPLQLLKRLRLLFKSIAGTKSIKLTTLNYLELKTSIPIEFISPEYLHRIAAPQKRRDWPDREGIRSFFYTSPASGTVIESYRITAARVVSYLMPGRGRGAWKVCQKTVFADKTKDFLQFPLEFRFDRGALRRIYGNSTIRARNYNRIVRAMKNHIIKEYLLDDHQQLKIPINAIPEPWRHARRTPRYREYDILKRRFTGKAKRQEEGFPWNLKSWAYNIDRIQYIDQLLHNDFWSRTLNDEWKQKYPFIFHGASLSNALTQSQLDTCIRLCSLRISDLPNLPDKVTEDLIDLYARYRVYALHQGNTPDSLYEWAGMNVRNQTPQAARELDLLNRFIDGQIEHHELKRQIYHQPQIQPQSLDEIDQLELQINNLLQEGSSTNRAEQEKSKLQEPSNLIQKPAKQFLQLVGSILKADTQSRIMGESKLWMYASVTSMPRPRARAPPKTAFFWGGYLW